MRICTYENNMHLCIYAHIKTIYNVWCLKTCTCRLGLAYVQQYVIQMEYPLTALWLNGNFLVQFWCSFSVALVRICSIVKNIELAVDDQLGSVVKSCNVVCTTIKLDMK